MTAARRSETTPATRRAMRAFRSVFFIVFVFSFFINLLALVSPFYMLQVYDRVLTSGSKETLYVLTLLAVGLLSVNAFLELVRSRVMTRIGNRLDAALGPELFAAVFRRRVEAPEAGGGQTLRDLDTMRHFVTGPGFLAFFDAPWTPAYIGLIFLFHPALGAVALAGAALLFALAVLTELATRSPVREAARQTHSAHRFVEQALRNAEAVDAMGMGERLRERWLERSLGGVLMQSTGADRSSILSATAKFIRPVLQVAVLGVGAFLVLEQQISAGVMIAASIVMGRALAPVEASISHWRALVASREARRRIDALLELENARPPRMPLPAPQGQVRVSNVTAAPPGSPRPVLVNVEFAAEPGELVAVVGRSASGKSSLARLLVGVWRPTVGHVRLDGADLRDWDPHQLGRHIGYLPQDVELFEGTVADNIARFERGAGGQPDAEAVVAAARLAGAHEAILALPQAYETRLGDGGAQLSGGQRQRVALARALYGDPRLLVLDEPDANLDEDGRAALAAALQRLREGGRTVFVISHRAQSLGGVDRLLIVEQGRVRAVAARPAGPMAEASRVVDLADKQSRGG